MTRTDATTRCCISAFSPKKRQRYDNTLGRSNQCCRCALRHRAGGSPLSRGSRDVLINAADARARPRAYDARGLQKSPLSLYRSSCHGSCFSRSIFSHKKTRLVVHGRRPTDGSEGARGKNLRSCEHHQVRIPIPPFKRQKGTS
jgi:hypothetical protein